MGPLEDIGGNVFAWLRDKEREEGYEADRCSEVEEQEESFEEDGTQLPCD